MGKCRTRQLRMMPPDKSGSRSRLTRRGLLVAGGVGLAAVAAGRWFNVTATTGDGNLSVADAHKAALAGQIVLVDIRRPDEWARTGVAEAAIALDMRDAGFMEQLLAAVEGERDTSIALICARGVRSRRLAGQMRDAGFTAVFDVPEGMLGSGAGPGWLKAGLPVTKG